MSDNETIERATRRLSAALDGLEAALDRRREVDGREAALTEHVAALGADRSRLAAELDTQTSRANRLDVATQEVSQRLDVVTVALRSVIEGQKER